MENDEKHIGTHRDQTISFAISSGLSGSICLLFFVGLDDEPPPFGVEWGHFEPACMFEEVGWYDGLREDKVDGSAIIHGEGWITFSGLDWF